MDIEGLGLDNEELHRIFRQGMQSVREFQDPVPDIMLQKRDKKTGGLTDVGEIHAISITFGLREGATSQGDPLTTSYADGDMRIPADGRIPEVGNVFVWDGHLVEITKVFPRNLFIVTCELRLVS